MGAEPCIRRDGDAPFVPTRRAGIRERRLLGPDESPHQNLVLVELEQGAEVEVHEVANSESLFVLHGRCEVVTADGGREPLGTGDLVHFDPRASHGLRCPDGPCRLLVVFAPSAGGGAR